jgi:hypothetical protein
MSAEQIFVGCLIAAFLAVVVLGDRHTRRQNKKSNGSSDE